METLRVHYCLDKPRDDRRCRARCGHWTTRHTDEPTAVTCAACRKLIGLPPKTDPMKTTLASILSLILASACDLDTGPDTSSSSSTGSAADESSSSTDDLDRAPPPSGATTGEVETTGGACVNTCDDTADCSNGRQCVPHPVTGESFCVEPCVSPGLCPALALACDGGLVEGECLPDSDGVPSCFAV